MMKIAHCSMLASLLFLFLSLVSCFPMETQQKQQQQEHDGKNSTDALRRRPAPPPTDANNTKPSPTNESQTMEKTVESGNGSSAAAAAGPRIPLTPAEAQARIFGQNPNATAEEVQKQIQDLGRVRDLLAEYNRKVKQLAAQRGQQLEPTPSNEEFKRRRKEKALQARLAAGDKTIPEQQNEHLKEYLFQGDILLTVEEAEALVRELDSQLKLLL